jgi:two-component system, NtrC family, response regulator AlgB
MEWAALVIDDDPGIRQSLRLCLEVSVARVLGVATAEAALTALDRGQFDVVFLDLWLGSDSGLTALPEILRRQPGMGVIVVTAYASIESAVEAMRHGAVDYLPKPFSPDQVRLAAERVLRTQRLQREVAELQAQVQAAEGEITFETRSERFRVFMQTAARVAEADCVVLLQGESGTGKNILARWLRAHSPRQSQPFATVHCPLLLGDLMTSTLFGHRKGAFTGATADAPRKVEEAEHGTLFLDEVAELTPDAQSRLLRFLNDRTYERVGDTKERQADVRVIAATNRVLEAAIREGRFREDLYFRLNVVTLHVPPLRERPEDILPLAHHYLDVLRARQGRRSLAFASSCEDAMQAYPWPGNLRELRNAIERAVILAPRDLIEVADLGLPGAVSASSPSSGAGNTPQLGGDYALEEIEREHIARVLARVASTEASARLLGIDPTTLQRKRKRYGLA